MKWLQQRVLGDREFSEELECYWQELKNKVDRERRRRQNRVLGFYRR